MALKDTPDGHMPNVYPVEEWTPEDAYKFSVFSSHCPMCTYKYHFAQLQHLIGAATRVDDEAAQKVLFEKVTEQQVMLLQLGLQIATQVDISNGHQQSAQTN